MQTVVQIRKKMAGWDARRRAERRSEIPPISLPPPTPPPHAINISLPLLVYMCIVQFYPMFSSKFKGFSNLFDIFRNGQRQRKLENSVSKLKKLNWQTCSFLGAVSKQNKTKCRVVLITETEHFKLLKFIQVI